ncbi:MAG: hypothetical protein ACP5T7_09570, partial [bacterium]
MIIINTSEKNTGIWRYINNIGLPIATLAVKDGNFEGTDVFVKKLKYTPFTLSLKYPKLVFKNNEDNKSLNEYIQG